VDRKIAQQDSTDREQFDLITLWRRELHSGDWDFWFRNAIEELQKRPIAKD
jgi:hypothetical protein